MPFYVSLINQIIINDTRAMVSDGTLFLPNNELSDCFNFCLFIGKNYMYLFIVIGTMTRCKFSCEYGFFFSYDTVAAR